MTDEDSLSPTADTPDDDAQWSVFDDAPEYAGGGPGVGEASPLYPSSDDDEWSAFLDAPEYASGGAPTTHDPASGPPPDAPRLPSLQTGDSIAGFAADLFSPSGAELLADAPLNATAPDSPGPAGQLDSAYARPHPYPPPPPTLKGDPGDDPISALVRAIMSPFSPPPPPKAQPKIQPTQTPAAVYRFAQVAPASGSVRINPNLPALVDPSTGLPPKTNAVLSRAQRLGVLFNELQSYSGDPLDDAIRLTAHALINGDETYGADRILLHKSAIADLPADLDSVQQRKLDEIARVYDQVIQERRLGVDPTNGATFFNQDGKPPESKVGSTRGPSGTQPTAFVGGLNNSYPTGDVPSKNAYIYTYADAKGYRCSPDRPHPAVAIQTYVPSAQ